MPTPAPLPTIDMPRLMKQVRVACQNMDIAAPIVQIAPADVLDCVCDALRQESVVVSFVGCDVQRKDSGVSDKSVYTDFALLVDGKYHTYSATKTKAQFTKGTSKTAGWLRSQGALCAVMLAEDEARQYLGVSLPSELEQSIRKIVRQELSQIAAEALDGAAAKAPRTRQRRL